MSENTVEKTIPPKKGIFAGRNLVWVVVGVIILVYIGLRQCGVDVVTTTEESELLDKPHR